MDHAFKNLEIVELWNEIIEDLDAPSSAIQFLKERDTLGLSEVIKNRVRTLLETGRKENAREVLTQEVVTLLEEQAQKINHTASTLCSTESSKDIGPFMAFGENMHKIRQTTGKSLSAFVRENLSESVARSTYHKIENGKTKLSVQAKIIRRVADELGVNPRILLINENMVRSFQAIYQNAILFDINYSCSSEQKSSIYEITGRHGMEMSPPLFEVLLRVMPLESIHDPSVAYGMVCGWGRPVDFPDEFHHGKVPSRFASAGLMGAFGNSIK